MNLRVISALLKKDFALFLSDRFYLLMSVVGVIFYIGVYFVLPARVDEQLRLAMHAPVAPPAFTQLTGQQGVDIKYFSDDAALRKAVLDGDYQVAISLPADIVDTWAKGGKPQITVYYASTAPTEVRDAIVLLVKELSYAQTGQALNFNTTQEILGPDLLGAQIPLRDRLRPLLAVFILLLEIPALASLISVEIEQGTARALFVTPMGVLDLFAAKGILGVGMAFGQAALFMLLVGGLSHEPLIVLTALLLGSMMAVGVGFLLASLAQDVMAVTGWGMLIYIVLAIPGFGTVIPGLLSDWAKVIPSYFLVDTVSRVASYGAGWADVGLNMALLAGFTALAIGAGMVALRRRYQ